MYIFFLTSFEGTVAMCVLIFKHMSHSMWLSHNYSCKRDQSIYVCSTVHQTAIKTRYKQKF